jgi:hypothetical protein
MDDGLEFWAFLIKKGLKFFTYNNFKLKSLDEGRDALKVLAETKDAIRSIKKTNKYMDMVILVNEVEYLIKKDMERFNE